MGQVLHGGITLQLRAKIEAAQRPHALRVHMQEVDIRGKAIQINPLHQMPGLNN